MALRLWESAATHDYWPRFLRLGGVDGEAWPRRLMEEIEARAEDEHPEVAAMALETLAGMGPHRLVFEPQYEHDRMPIAGLPVAHHVRRAVGRRPEIALALLDYLTPDEMRVIGEALADNREPRALPKPRHLLRHRHPEKRAEAAVLLARFFSASPEDAASELAVLQGDADKRVRAVAERVLSPSGPEETEPAHDDGESPAL